MTEPEIARLLAEARKWPLPDQIRLLERLTIDELEIADLLTAALRNEAGHAETPEYHGDSCKWCGPLNQENREAIAYAYHPAALLR
jgi:hypothetical protein